MIASNASNFCIVRSLCLIGVLAVASGSAAQPELSATERYRGMVVRDVRLVYEGPEMPQATRALVDLEPGDIYRPDAVRRSIRQLFALGSFSDIKVEAEIVPGPEISFEDEVDVVFRLYPRFEVQAVEVQGLDPGLENLEDRLI